MNIRLPHRLLALGVLGFALHMGAAVAAEYTNVHLHIDVDKSADEVWKKIGGFCDIKDWLSLPCEITSGSGDLGTVRSLTVPRGNAKIEEVMVAKTDHSYTYTQPTTTILYHGTLEVVPEGKHKSRINYSLVWDQAPLANDEAKGKDRDQRTKNFTAALENMKKLAEGK